MEEGGRRMEEEEAREGKLVQNRYTTMEPETGR